MDKYGTIEKATEKFNGYKANTTENNVNILKKIADLVINTADSPNEHDITVRVASFLKLLPAIHSKLVDIVVGGQFGSEGKGQICSHLAPEYDCLIRVGGPNAGHKVYNTFTNTKNSINLPKLLTPIYQQNNTFQYRK